MALCLFLAIINFCKGEITMTNCTIIKKSKKIKIKIGDKFGKLTVKKDLGTIKGRPRFECICECGNIRIKVRHDLYSGRAKSCGCSRVTHGMTNTPTYMTWQHITDRCNNPNSDRYHYYGGRGITVCEQWTNFEQFFKDMGERPDGLTIERKNNELGYFKENCKWATQSEQLRNQRLRNDNKTGTRGIDWDKYHQKYHVRIGINRKTIQLGYFATLGQAKIARQQGEQKYWE
jgi:hypothetical protein